MAPSLDLSARPPPTLSADLLDELISAVNRALDAIWKVVADANRYFAGEAPWALAKTDPKRKLTVIGDIACDPTSDFSPIKVYTQATDWDLPALRVWDSPPLDVMAIDNLPSLMPVESSEDYAAQLLPSLLTLKDLGAGVWGRAKAEFDRNIAGLGGM